MVVFEPSLANYARYKLIKWRFRYFSKNKQVLECRFPGIGTPIYLRPGHFDLKVFKAVMLEEEYRLEFRHAPAVIVDAGAHIGLAAVYFANRYPDARIFCLEPNPGNFEVLQSNIEQYENIVPIKAALWNRREKLQWVDEDADDWAYRVKPGDDSSAAAVDAVDLSWLCAEFDIDAVDLLKVDIEGAEADVFASNTGWIEKIRVIAIELHDRFRPGCKEAFDTATADFEDRWSRGENTFVARAGTVTSGDHR